MTRFERRLWAGLGLTLLAAIAVLTAAIAWFVHEPATPSTQGAGLQLGDVLADELTDGYARADGPRTFRFPADHGPHPAFRSEWWYLTGHLTAADGERFGVMFTIFRFSLRPGAPEHPSAWATDQIFMAHAALSELDRGRFTARERFSRGAVGLAGAEAEPFRVWLEDWSIGSAGSTTWPWIARYELTAEDPAGAPGFATARATEVRLELTPLREPVLQGDRGLSQKSAEVGNASYYYSIPRLAATGTITRDGGALPVSGELWLDREWSTSALAEDQAGWDWFALQLEDNRELMYYQLRDADGSPDPQSAGMLLAASGEVTRLTRDEVRLTVTDRWQSPRGGRYPAGWRLEVPARGLDLTIKPLLADQEMALTFRYWEGAVAVSGRDGDKAVAGTGYAELTGYAE